MSPSSDDRLHHARSGRLIKAPENFIGSDGVRLVFSEAKAGRRDFVRNAFAAAIAGAAVPAALAQTRPSPADGGDASILELPAHSKAANRMNAYNTYLLLEGSAPAKP